MKLARTHVVVAMAGVALAGTACAHRPGLAEKMARYGGIEVVGARGVDPDTIAGLVRRAGTEDLDVTRVREWYAMEGYLEAKVDVVRLGTVGGRSRFQVRIVEGRLARVGRLTLYGLDDVPEARSWPDALPLRPGSVFSAEAREETMPVLKAALLGAGFAEADGILDAFLDRGTLEARVSILVDPGRRGEPYRFGKVFIGHWDEDEKRRIRRAIEPVVPPTEAFDVARIEVVRQRVREIVGRRRVSVRVGPVDERRREIVLLIEVRSR